MAGMSIWLPEPYQREMRDQAESLIHALFICQVKAISREKQEEEVKAQEDSNSRHATRHQVGLL